MATTQPVTDDEQLTATPPDDATTGMAWVRKNLFPDVWNSLLTLTLGPLLAWGVFALGRFLFVTGRWEIVTVNLTTFMVGRYPRDQLFRLWIAVAILALVIGLAIGVATSVARAAAASAGRDHDRPWHEPVRRFGPPVMLLVVMAVFVQTATPLLLLAAVLALGAVAYRLGRLVPLRRRGQVNLVLVIGVISAQVAITGFGGVPRSAWGGLLLTFYFTIGALLFAFPLGVVVALGRRSTLPVVRGTCMVYIEFFRGMPLVVLLFTGWLVLPFFLPPQFPTPNIVTRAMIILVLFTSAYVAEIVRGGLQGLPRGQREAAQALGLSPWKQTRLIILPQALRSVIPALVGQAISLYKDTTLVLAVGLLELLQVARIIPGQEAFRGQGLFAETLVFVSLIYWVGSYWMSRESQRLEAKLGVGER
jgi:general L-amino acid transport system permease protein